MTNRSSKKSYFCRLVRWREHMDLTINGFMIGTRCYDCLDPRHFEVWLPVPQHKFTSLWDKILNLGHSNTGVIVEGENIIKVGLKGCKGNQAKLRLHTWGAATIKRKRYIENSIDTKLDKILDVYDFRATKIPVIQMSMHHGFYCWSCTWHELNFYWGQN